MRTNPTTFLPLRPVDLILLLTLVDGEQHGYALAREIAERTDGVVQLGAGNLYRVIKRLLDDGLVAQSARRPLADDDDERRVYYKITPLGARVAALEAQRLRTLLSSKAARSLSPLADRA